MHSLFMLLCYITHNNFTCFNGIVDFVDTWYASIYLQLGFNFQATLASTLILRTPSLNKDPCAAIVHSYDFATIYI